MGMAGRTGMAARMLRHARGSAGLTQRALAAKTGAPQETIARIESGRANPRITTLDRLLEGCGQGLEHLPRLGIGIDRLQIRERLALAPSERLARNRSGSPVERTRASHIADGRCRPTQAPDSASPCPDGGEDQDCRPDGQNACGGCDGGADIGREAARAGGIRAAAQGDPPKQGEPRSASADRDTADTCHDAASPPNDQDRAGRDRGAEERELQHQEPGERPQHQSSQPARPRPGARSIARSGHVRSAAARDDRPSRAPAAGHRRARGMRTRSRWR